jgi:hypothetical protein
MGEEVQSRLGRVSKREIAAAWVCCGVVIVGAILADLGAGRDDSAAAAYAGAHIPGGAGQRLRGPDVDDESGGSLLAEIGTFSNNAEPIVISSAERPTITEPARGPKSGSRYCRYVFRQSGIRYSAAARLAEAGAGVGAGVREAAQ